MSERGSDEKDRSEGQADEDTRADDRQNPDDDSADEWPDDDLPGDDAQSGREAPLSGLRANIEERRQQRQQRESSNPAVDDAFQEAATDPVVDGEQVWEDLLAGQDEDAGVLAFGEQVESESADVRIIPNRVCHSCTHFGDPPELHCTHDGTTIRRMVDMAHYEVVECPVVKNRSDLTE